MKSRKSVLCMIIAVVMVFALLLGSVTTSFAATKAGKGGTAFAGASVNTFAAGLPLATVYLDPEVIKKGPSEKPTYQGDKFTLGGEKGMNAQVGIGKVKINETYKDMGKFVYTYKDAAVFSNGKRGDVIVDMSIAELKITSSDPSVNADTQAKITFTDMAAITSGFEVSVGTLSDSSAIYGVWAHLDTTIKITNGSDTDDFIIPVNGANISKSSSDTYYKSLYDLDPTDHKYSRETIILKDENVFYPEGLTEEIKSEGGKVKVRAIGSGQENKDYRAGMATIGKSDYTVTFQGMGSSASTNQDRSNVMNLSIGDLQHRITSGSGTGGKIETGKSGTGTDLEGGTFTGDVSGITGNEETTRRYVIPDAKTGVTYTMTPDSGYALEKVVVDGRPYTVPDTPLDTYALDNTEGSGSGTLKHVGNGKFTYSFDKANTKDHTIYVTWKKVQIDPVKIKLTGTKTLKEDASDKVFSDGDYKFKIKQTESTPAGLTANIPNESVSATSDGKIDFGEIEFTEAGTYVFEIEETGTAPAGYTFDDKKVQATVKVKLDTGNKLAQDGAIEYKKQDDSGTYKTASGISFENKYTTPDPIEIPVKVEKTLTEKIDGEGDVAKKFDANMFKFSVTRTDSNGNDVTGVPNKEVGVAASDANGKAEVDFGKWTFSKEGTYEFKIREIAAASTGYKYDDKEIIVKIRVSLDESDNKLKHTISYTKDGKDVTANPSFENEYKCEPTEVNLPVKKIIVGSPQTKETFTFRMKAVSNTAGYEVAKMPMPSGSTNGENGKSVNGAGDYEFGKFKITKPGTYVYAVTEDKGSAKGWTYDESRYTITWEVKDAGGRLEATRTIVNQVGKSYDTCTFINNYEDKDVDTDTDEDTDTDTDTGTKTKTDKKVPTGDENSLALMITICSVTFGALITLIVRRRRNN